MNRRKRTIPSSETENETGTNPQNSLDESPTSTDTRRAVTSRRSLLLTGGALGLAMPSLSPRALGRRGQKDKQRKDGYQATQPSANSLQAPPQTLDLQKLTASNGTAYDMFGRSVAVSGDVALVGADWGDNNDNNSGPAYVFRFDGNQWIEAQKLTPSDNPAGVEFGRSVAVSDDIALIGAPSDSAYVFRFDGSQWTEEQKLTPSDNPAGGEFASSVAVSDDVALIGAYRDDDDGTHSGSAYVFRFDGSQWIEAQKLTASDSAKFDQFGRSVAVMNDIALIGAWADGDNGLYSGSAYVFQFDGNQWIEAQKLTPSDGAPRDLFGASVAMSDDVALIGAYRDDDNGKNSGSAYVFRFDGCQWTEEQKLTAEDGATYDRFGKSVAVSDDGVLVGAPSEDDMGVNPGSAYLYRFDGSQWTEEQKLTANDGAIGDEFGASVAMSDGVGLIGTPKDDDNGDKSGSAYIFTLETNPFTEPISLPNGKLLTPVDRDGDGLFEDLNGDGDTDEQDVSRLAQLVTAYRRGEVTLTNTQVAALDFNRDGELTQADISAYNQVCR